LRRSSAVFVFREKPQRGRWRNLRAARERGSGVPVTQPTRHVEDIDKSTHFTYGEEEPNSLLVEEVALFLAAIQRFYH
jgi:hypothetical protein